MKQVIINRRLVMVLLCLFVVLISVSSASATSTVYVNATGGNDSNNGTIDHPYQTIGQGINSVDENGAVHIADGTYSGTGNTNLTINKNMNITGQSQTGTIINGTNTNWIFQINNGVTVNIQNLTLTNGNTTTDGGAIYNQGTLNISGCTFTNNTANMGSAIYNHGSITNVTGCTFNSNTATDFGGAICNQGPIDNVTGCTFTNNTANNGGAICNFDTINNLTGCTFTGNTANNGGAIFNLGHMSVPYNWWGSNNGPSSDQIFGDTIFGPWLCMNITVDPGNIVYGGNGTVTVSFNNAFDGKGIPVGVHIPDGTIVNFSSSLGTFNPTQAVTKDGIATTTFTATNTGTGDVSAKTDDQTVSETITVNKAATTLIVDNVTGVKGQEVNLTATLKDSNGALAGQTITFHINGTDYTATTKDDGTATYFGYIINQSMGTYPITANFNNGTIYTNSTGTGNLTVNLINTTLTVDNVTGVKGQEVNLTATLKDSNGALAGQTITFHINGTDYTATTKDDGTATYFGYIINQSMGTYPITANFNNGTIYTNSTGTGNLTVNLINTTLTVDNVTGVKGQEVNLTATLKDSNGALAGQTITFHINGTDYTATTKDDGTATYFGYIINQSMGTYPITANFNNGTIYTNSTGTGNLTVNLINTTLTVDNVTGVKGQEVNLTATLKDSNGALAGQTITFHINGTDYTATTKDDGTATYFGYIINQSMGTYPITANFNNGTIYTNSTGTGNLTVNLINTTLTVDNVTGVKGQEVNLTATLKDSNGALAGQTITFHINGTDYTATTKDDGTATYFGYIINQSMGTYPITANFNNGTIYTNSTGTGNLTVNLINTTLTVDNVTGVKGQEVNLTATLKDSNGALAGQTITFHINGTDYTATTKDDGTATYFGYIINQSMGTYPITANFNNGTIYTNSTGTGNLTVNLINTTLTVDNVTGVKGQEVNLTATLKDSNGALAGQTITFHINGTDYTATTKDDGTATYFGYIINQSMGTYPITANFNNGTIYTNSTGTGNLTVNLINTTLTVDNVTGVKGQEVNLTATLKDSNGALAGQTITFHINGTDYTATTKDDGTATYFGYIINQSMGTYPITANFNNGTIYTNSTGTGNLTVNPAANLYIDTTTNNKNPTIGQTFILTYKLGNYGPDAADNVTVTFQLPEGLDFVDIKVDNGKYSYDPTTRTVTWTMNSVPIGDPYLYLTVKAVSAGTYTIKPNITSTTYNMNTGNQGNITINIQNSNNNNNNNSNNGSSTNTVNAATQTVAMQHTGVPLAGLALAILAIFGGMLPRRKQ